MKSTFIKIIAGVALGLFCNSLGLLAQAPEANKDVSEVCLIFKTHLDIGFTDLSSVVEERYVKEFIPKAMDIADELRKSGGEERYVWTTGSWLVQSFLDQAAPQQKARFEQSIRQGDIVWNAMPYTVESESMSKNHFRTILELSHRLDRQFGMKTTGAKMTDVPGHTRSIVPLLSEAGISFLHIGVNPASKVPSVPPVCRWQGKDGSEIILMYQKDYGSDMVLPDGKTAVVIAFTGDNHGPHSAAQVKNIYASIHQRYPKARIMATSLNQVATRLESMKDKLPVLKEEIGDTWIYGYGSSPLRMARFREISRLYDQWIADGKIDPESEEAISFAVRLGLIAEHTWGVDVKTHIKNWDKYEWDAFTVARQLPEFQKAERSWEELSANVDQAITYLPEALRKEAVQALSAMEQLPAPVIGETKKASDIAGNGSWKMKHKGVELVTGLLSYQTFSQTDYDRYFKSYMTHPFDWAFKDFGKPGLDATSAVSVTLEPAVAASSERKVKGGKAISCRLELPKEKGVDERFYPENIYSNYTINEKKGTAEISLTWVNKTANRLPEAYWFSFYPENVVELFVQKTGETVNVLDVVEGGNRQMHGIDRYVDVKTTAGIIRITSLDAPLVAIGERNLLNYSTQQPDITLGIHFCLFNNLWGTNFSQWFEGNITFRFKVEVL